jgi:transketolase
VAKLLTETKKKELEILAAKIRLECLKEFKYLGFGHVGGSMSIVETLAVLYGGIMKINPQNPGWPERDWLVVSKGHAGPAVYATLALKGYFPIEQLKTLNQPGTDLPSHCDRNKTKGIDMTTGSLGQGISTAIGVALGNRIDQRDSYTYLIIGDGECDEGQIWEGALFAAHQQLDRLIMFIDYNHQQLDGYTKDINDLGDLKQKFVDFGWYGQEVDGADLQAIYEAVENAQAMQGRPAAIVLQTKKGYGCTFAEGIVNNHHMTFSEEQVDTAITRAGQKLEEALA